MSQVTESGAVVMPPVPAFYNRPASVEEIVDDTVNRSLDLLGLDVGNDRRWTGERNRTSQDTRREGDRP
jgi:4-hydroxy-3-polyprenylbenzoate decarboxylase